MIFINCFSKICLITVLSVLAFFLITSCNEDEKVGMLTNLNINEDSLDLQVSYSLPPPSDSILVGDSLLYPFVVENSQEKEFFHLVEVRWSSDDITIATVTEEGWIIGKKKGQTTIKTFVNGGKTDSLLLTVLGKDDIKSIAISSQKVDLEEGGVHSLQVLANNFNDSSFLISENLNWETDNPTVAVVNATGVVTGVDYGNVTISAFYNSLKSSITLEVLNVADWSNRDSMGELIFDNKMWILGGYGHGGICKNDIWSSENGRDWVEVSPEAPWSLRNLMGAVVFKNKMWILGGSYARINRVYNDIWYSENGSEWVLATDNPPWSKRTAFGCVVFNDKIWIMGGFGQNNEHYNDVWSSEDGINWILVTDQAPWQKRSLFDAAIFNGKIWVLGGGIYQTKTNYNDVWSSEDGVNWIQAVDNAQWPARRFFSSNVFDNKLWIAGGIYENTNDHNLNDVWSSEDGKTWTQVIENADWSNRHEAGLMVYHDKMWILGGIGFNNVIFRDIWLSSDGEHWKR